jgi:hypothetical protein
MKTKTEIETCEECGGAGWLGVWTDHDCGSTYIMREKPEYGESYYEADGCSKCGGRGEKRIVWKKKFFSSYETVEDTMVKGSGKVKNTYGWKDSFEFGKPYGSWYLISSEPSGGCFLTTAACIFKGLPDNCEELVILRQFRDEYLSNSVSGQALVLEYYQTAPQISQMMTEQDMLYIFSMIQQCVALIKENNNEAALSLYKSAFRVMRNKYIK